MALKCVIEMSKIDSTTAQAQTQPLRSHGRLAEVWLELTWRTVCQTLKVQQRWQQEPGTCPSPRSQGEPAARGWAGLRALPPPSPPQHHNGPEESGGSGYIPILLHFTSHPCNLPLLLPEAQALIKDEKP